MVWRIRFVFVVFYLAVVLVLAVHFRNSNNRIFYQLCSVDAEQSRLKQQLGEKQLLLENLISPAVVSQGVVER